MSGHPVTTGASPQSNAYYYAPLAQSVNSMLASPARRPSSGWSRPGRPSGSSQPKKHCNCKNSRCLKLYCECFASGRYCDGCNCNNCCNNKESESTRKAAVEAILERNPNAFRPKIQGGTTEDGLAASATARHNKGCNCKKSGCLKKYCECFQAGIFCSDNCKCLDCKNFEGSEAREAVMMTAQQDSRPPTSPPPPKRGRALPALQFAPKHTVAAQPLHKPSMPVYPATAQPALVSQAVLPSAANMIEPAFMQPIIKHEVQLAPPQPTIPPRQAVREVVNDMVKQGAVDKLCHLLLVACQEKADEFKIADNKDEDLANAGPSGSNSAAETDAMDADRQDLGSPSTTGSTTSKVYEAQEKAVLQEFDVFLKKLNNRVQSVIERNANANQLGSGPAGSVPLQTGISYQTMGVVPGSQGQLVEGQNSTLLHLAPFQVGSQQPVSFVMQPGNSIQSLQIPSGAFSGAALQQLLSGMAVIQAPGTGNLQLTTLQLQPAGVGTSQSANTANGSGSAPVTYVLANPQDVQGRTLQVMKQSLQGQAGSSHTESAGATQVASQQDQD